MAAPPSASRSSFRRNLVFSAVSTTALFLWIEGGASLLLSLRSAKHALRMAEEAHVRYDADLGWSHVPGRVLPSLYGEGKSFSINDQGFRAREHYEKTIPAGRHRVVCLGDSFTMGFGVGDDEHYPAQMQSLCPRLQVVNMGQGGYGLDQIYLWYKRDGVTLDANLLVVAVIAHDFYRMTDERFVGYEKPALRVRDGALVVTNVPVPQTFGRRTPLVRARTLLESLALTRLLRFVAGRTRIAEETFYGQVDDQVLAAAGLALDDLVSLSRAREQQMALVYLPSSDLLPREPTREAAWMEAYARRQGIPFANLAADFGSLPPWELARLFRPDYHYTEAGNRFVAETLLKRLGPQVSLPTCRP
jgi:hypothetical protein